MRGGPSIAFWTIVLGASLAYVSSIAWGLGLPALAVGTAGLTAVAAMGWLCYASQRPDVVLFATNATSRAASGFLLGATLCSMLLGHYYLTAPAMTIEPLKRTIMLIAWGLAARALLAGAAISIVQAGLVNPVSTAADPDLLVLLFGAGAWDSWRPRLRTYMTWRTALDSLDAIGDGHSLHHHDLCLFWRAFVTGALRAGRRYLLKVAADEPASISGVPNDYNRGAA